MQHALQVWLTSKSVAFHVVTQWSRQTEISLSRNFTISVQMRIAEWLRPTSKCFSSEVIGSLLLHPSLASHMAFPDERGAKMCNPHVCREGKEIQGWASIRIHCHNNLIFIVVHFVFWCLQSICDRCCQPWTHFPFFILNYPQGIGNIDKIQNSLSFKKIFWKNLCVISLWNLNSYLR